MEKERIEYFDGLRGYAVWAVFNESFNAFRYWHSPITQCLMGLYGDAMIIWFMLSGRLIGLSILNHPTVKTFASSVLRRPIRLVYPVLISLWIHCIFSKMGVYHVNEAIKSEISVKSPFIEYLYDINYTVDGDNTTFAGTIEDTLRSVMIGVEHGRAVGSTDFDNFSSINNLKVTWMIPIEFKLSMLTFIIAMLSSGLTFQSKVVLYSLVLTAVAWINSYGLLFILGLLLAEASNSGIFVWINKQRWRSLVHFAFALVPLLHPFLHEQLAEVVDVQLYFPIIWHTKGLGLPKEHWGILSLYRAIFAFSLLGLIELNSTVQSIFSSRPLIALGQYAFAFYLIHPVWLQFSQARIISAIDAIFPNSPHLQPFFVYILVLVTMIPLLYVFFKIGDKPGRSFGFIVQDAVFAKNLKEDEQVPVKKSKIKVGHPKKAIRNMKNGMSSMAKEFLAFPMYPVDVAMFSLKKLLNEVRFIKTGYIDEDEDELLYDECQDADVDGTLPLSRTPSEIQQDQHKEA